MINIINGEVLLENIQYTLSFNTQIDLFSKTFSQELIRNIDDMKTGYRGYYIWGSIVDKEEVILLALCFNPSNHLGTITIYPFITPVTNFDDRDIDWSKDKLLCDKSFSDDWLKRYFNLETENPYKWGNISSVIDERSWSSSIVIRYL
ncbi:MAG: hypothetical protein QM644_13310 [Mobilitalea sp.]